MIDHVHGVCLHNETTGIVACKNIASVNDMWELALYFIGNINTKVILINIYNMDKATCMIIFRYLGRLKDQRGKLQMAQKYKKGYPH